MPARLRQRREPTDDWQQPQLLFQFPEQLTYALIRPVVLFGHSPAERARQTGAAARTRYRQAARFSRDGMASLFAPHVEKHHRLPTAVREAICALKAEHPPLNTDEITTICWVRFGHRPSSHTSSASWQRIRLLRQQPVATRPLTMLPRRRPPIRQRRGSRSSACTARAGTSRASPPPSMLPRGRRSRDGPCHPDALDRGRRRRPRRPSRAPHHPERKVGALWADTGSTGWVRSTRRSGAMARR